METGLHLTKKNPIEILGEDSARIAYNLDLDAQSARPDEPNVPIAL